MKLITLLEPWATLMATGAKQIETRSWRTRYRGWLAIHASKGGLSRSALIDCLAEDAFVDALSGVELKPGHIVAVVSLVDCCPMEDCGCLPGVFRDYPELDTSRERAFGDYSVGRWAWVTSDRFRLIDPIPFRGRQGLIDVPDETLAEIRKQWKNVEARYA